MRVGDLLFQAIFVSLIFGFSLLFYKLGMSIDLPGWLSEGVAFLLGLAAAMGIFLLMGKLADRRK